MADVPVAAVAASAGGAIDAKVAELQPIKPSSTPEVEIYLHLLVLMFVSEQRTLDEVSCFFTFYCNYFSLIACICCCCRC